jgi:tRNA pseudouridine55 synthase
MWTPKSPDAVVGILLLDKPSGPTSHDAVARVRRTLAVRRVGHFGTLDPFASGLLVLGVGAATRLAPYATAHRKSYRALVHLGARSSTDDPEGVIEPVAVAVVPRPEAVEAACTRWTGTVAQIPPAYSAKHVAGERAYARARAGETVSLPPVRVTVERIEILRYQWPELEIEITCGPGTYVRGLARDLGGELGTAGYCAELRRTRSGPFSVDEAVPWSALGDRGRLEAALRPAESAVVELPRVRLAAAEARAAAQGRAVPAVAEHVAEGWVRLAGPDGFIGIGTARPESRGAWLQPRTVLFPAGETPR